LKKKWISATSMLMTCFGLNANSRKCKISLRHYKYLDKNNKTESYK
jgi:hypothetical protein